MRLPKEAFAYSICEKKIYYFSSTKLNTNIPHYYICISRTPSDLLILSCCTSQFETVEKFVRTRKLPESTLVRIKPEEGNPFDRSTYINCNEYHSYTVEEFCEMNEHGKIDFGGEISNVYYEQILIGLLESPLIDEETKETLPNPDDL